MKSTENTARHRDWAFRVVKNSPSSISYESIKQKLKSHFEHKGWGRLDTNLLKHHLKDLSEMRRIIFLGVIKGDWAWCSVSFAKERRLMEWRILTDGREVPVRAVK